MLVREIQILFPVIVHYIVPACANMVPNVVAHGGIDRRLRFNTYARETK